MRQGKFIGNEELFDVGGVGKDVDHPLAGEGFTQHQGPDEVKTRTYKKREEEGGGR